MYYYPYFTKIKTKVYMWLVCPNLGSKKFLCPIIALGAYLITSRDSSTSLGNSVVMCCGVNANEDVHWYRQHKSRYLCI